MRAALLGYALFVLLATPRALGGRGWVARSPRLGLWAWLGSSLAMGASLLVVAISTLLPVRDVRLDARHLLHACAAWLPGDSTVADLLLAVLALLPLVGLGAVALVRGRRARQVRHRQRDLLDLVSIPLGDRGAGVWLLEQPQPMAWVIPGRRARIVLTTGVRDLLGAAELDAVLRHEGAHLRGRHHLLLGWTAALRTAVPLPMFALQALETAELVEMLADDSVLRRGEQRQLTQALLALGRVEQAPGPAPAVERPATTQRRVARLQASGTGMPWPARSAAIAIPALLILVPLLGGAPTVAAASGLCVPGG